MALESGADAAAKRPRPPGCETGQHDHLSALPEPHQLRILTFLLLRSAILASSLSRAWRGLWARHLEDDGTPSSSLHPHLLPYSTPSSTKLLEALELRQSQGRRGRIDRYSLVIDTLTMLPRGFGRYLATAARGGVEDLRVELRRTSPDTPLLFPFPAAAGPALARLSLRGIGVSGLHSRAARPCAALEVVLLHSVRLDDRDLARMLALCPRLRVLGLCSCTGISRVVVTAAMGLASLRSVTVVDCSSLIAVDFTVVSSLRSFRYSGGCFFYLPGDALFADLDIRFGVQKSRNVLICQVFSDWFETRVCSKLTALTICSNVLFVVSSLLNATSHAGSAKMGGEFFRSMTELQLIMLEMKAPELANIYVFLKNSGCSNLERLFVQLPTTPSRLLVDSFDYVGLEPPPDVLENLKVVKITNFSWNHFELQLVCFLLRKASSLRKLLLITPSSVPLHVPGIQKADLLFLGEAVANGKVIVSGSDDAATQPFHSDASAISFRCLCRLLDI